MGLLDGLFGPAGSEQRLQMKMSLMGLTHNPNTALMQQWSNDLGTMRDERKATETRNKTAQYLRSLGTPQAMQAADALEAGMLDASSAYQMATKQPDPVDPWAGTKVIGDDVYRMGPNGPELVLDAGGTAGGVGDVTYGLTPQRYVRADGSIGFGVLGNDGSFKEVALPEGAKPAPNVDRIDAGDRWILMDQMGNVIGEQPKNLEEAAAATERGKAIGTAQGEAITGEGSAVQKAMQGIQLIEAIKNDPALASVTGNFQGRLPPGIPMVTGGQSGANVGIKIEQLQGQAFLEAFQSLKGGGAITEREGAAAQAAIARLQRPQDEAEYLRSLNELQGILQLGVRRAQEKASSARGEAPAQNNNDPLGLFE